MPEYSGLIKQLDRAFYSTVVVNDRPPFTIFRGVEQASCTGNRTEPSLKVHPPTEKPHTQNTFCKHIQARTVKYTHV